MGCEIVAAQTLAKVKACHEQVSSRDNPSPSAFAQKHNKVAPRVGRYLTRGNPPPSDTLLDDGMKVKPKTDFQSIHEDTYPGHVRTVGMLLELRNVQPVLSRDVVPLPNGSKRPLGHRHIERTAAVARRSVRRQPLACGGCRRWHVRPPLTRPFAARDGRGAAAVGV
ncbi:hypothetical protein GW17_00034835 [Ensete ventricosum]|nr:hypothetical protein GW17_00034835 [Ensete ventricosum]